jgi:hypothetical protein
VAMGLKGDNLGVRQTSDSEVYRWNGGGSGSIAVGTVRRRDDDEGGGASI